MCQAGPATKRRPDGMPLVSKALTPENSQSMAMKSHRKQTSIILGNMLSKLTDVNSIVVG